MTDFLSELKMANHEYLHRIWKAAQIEGPESLPREDRLLAEIRLEHEEFHNQFEMADVLGEHQYDPDSEVNPFAHIIFHSIVENQLKAGDPIEAYQFYNAMRRNKISRHETIHCIAMILTFLMHGVLSEKKPFDLERYKSLLRRHKDRKPEKIHASLLREFGETSE